MVALSLYKGNLHKVPDVPRRWTVPSPTISRKDFKKLLHRRSKAVARLRSSTATPSIAEPAPNPNPSIDKPDPAPAPAPAGTDVNGKNDGKGVDDSRAAPELPRAEDPKEGDEAKMEERREAKDEKLMETEEKIDAMEEENRNAEGKPEVNANQERSITEDAKSDKGKRIKEVKEKLEILNEKKHSLVQVLKQILNAEEQLKRQNSTQGISGRPPLPLQLDAATDSVSMTRVTTPRIGSDGNPSGDMEGGEGEDISNQNIHSRILPRLSSTSPSSESQQRKPSVNIVPHTYRTTLGVAGSPSRFAPAVQGHSSVSVTGTSYIASSPSPAASGGTSVFRDGKLSSPWN